jgi:hypothetical protein
MAMTTHDIQKQAIGKHNKARTRYPCDNLNEDRTSQFRRGLGVPARTSQHRDSQYKQARAQIANTASSINHSSKPWFLQGKVF